MYDFKAIQKTYVETYHANGGNTTLAKQEAIRIHGVEESERWMVSIQLSGSESWDKISEIPTEWSYRKKTPPPKKEFRKKDWRLLLDLQQHAEQANLHICPVDD